MHEFFVFDADGEGFFDGEDDFEHGEGVDAEVFDEASVFVHRGDFFGVFGGSVAFDDAEDNLRNFLCVFCLAEVNDGIEGFVAAASKRVSYLR